MPISATLRGTGNNTCPLLNVYRKLAPCHFLHQCLFSFQVIYQHHLHNEILHLNLLLNPPPPFQYTQPDIYTLSTIDLSLNTYIQPSATWMCLMTLYTTTTLPTYSSIHGYIVSSPYTLTKNNIPYFILTTILWFPFLQINKGTGMSPFYLKMYTSHHKHSQNQVASLISSTTLLVPYTSKIT